MSWDSGQAPNPSHCGELGPFKAWGLDLERFRHFRCPDFPAKDGNSQPALEITNCLATLGLEMRLFGEKIFEIALQFLCFTFRFSEKKHTENQNLPLIFIGTFWAQGL